MSTGRTMSGRVEKTFIVCCQVQEIDSDLLESDIIPNAIRAKFAGTAVRIIECEPERTEAERTEAEQLLWDLFAKTEVVNSPERLLDVMSEADDDKREEQPETD